MRLGQVCEGLPVELLQGSLDEEIVNICYDSRKAVPGSLFVCIAGLKTDGHLFTEQAVQNGALAVLAEREVPVTEQVTLLKTPNTRQALAWAAANLYEHPSADLKVIGVTGTNGKTTTTHLIQAILEENHQKTGIMGTLYARLGDVYKEYGHTTPEASDIQEFLRFLADQGAEYAVMEVSSHALDLHRVDRLGFYAAAFTNLTQDHLDYHGSMEQYREAKLKLFAMVSGTTGRFCIVNKDDPAAGFFIGASSVPHYTYGIHADCHVRAVDIHSSLKGTDFQVKYGSHQFPISMKMIGGFSVYNALAAITFALAEQIPIPVIQGALAKVSGVPGRFEQVDLGQDYTVVVDYAHTPDGLENILSTARDVVVNRLITVFGCGGDRDRTKRPLMGEIAGKYSDFSVVTSDNPRTEDPLKIIEDILPGIDQIREARYAVIPDRREAIHHAIHMARAGDLVVIAGKGHETYQLVNDQVLDFDDRQVAAEFIKEKRDREN